MNIYYAKTCKVLSPIISTEKSVGVDFFIPDIYSQDELTIMGKKSILLRSGIKVKLPTDTCLILFNKSGVSTKQFLLVGACVIDEDYQGEIHFHFFNMSDGEIRLKKEQKIVQGILLPNYKKNLIQLSVDDLYTSISTRGSGGFGSTGIS